MLLKTSRWFDQRLGVSKYATKQLNKVFPDHWSFMLGEITLYCFVILLITGTFLTFFFEPSIRPVEYHGSYAPLHGEEMSAAYASGLHISFDVRTGLVMRQMHHWAALMFVAAMVVHLLRVFFTGAYRRPREMNWIIGVNLLILSIFNGLLGYSLLDDLLSATGLRVAYNMLLSIPFIGPLAANLLFGDRFPGDDLIPRFFVIHVLLLPAVIVGLLSAHLALVWYQKHTQFKGHRRREDNVIGTRLFPTYATKALGLFFLVSGMLALLGGLVQINPIWVFGPFESAKVSAAVTSAAQPDWYMGWLDGILRVIPGWETRVFGLTLPNPFWGGVVVPGITFTVMMLWPFLEPKWTKDRDAHNLLERPRDNPFRAAIGAAVVTFYTILTFAGSNDVLATIFHVAPESITVAFRWMLIVFPIVAFLITRKICQELQGTDEHPAYPSPSHEVVRTPEGGYSFGHDDEHGDDDEDDGHEGDGDKAH